MLISEMKAEEIRKLTHAILDDNGKEINNPIPTETSIPMGKHEPLAQRIAQIMHRMSSEAAKQGYETEAEANDFTVDEDNDPITQYEVEAMLDEVPTPQVPEPSGSDELETLDEEQAVSTPEPKD